MAPRFPTLIIPIVLRWSFRGPGGTEIGSIDGRAPDGTRETIDQLTYLAYGARADLAAWVGDYSATVTHPTYHDVSAIDNPVKMEKQTAGELRYCVKNDTRLAKLPLANQIYCAFGGRVAQAGVADS